MKKFFADEEVKEICFTLTLSFLPLILSAFVALRIENAGFLKAFFGYFDSGELGLYILSTCGALAFILVIKTKVKIEDNLWLFVFCFLAPIMGAAVIIGTNPKFDKGLPPEQHVLLILIYMAAIYGWYRSMKIKKDSDKKLEEAKRALNQGQYSTATELEAINRIIGN